MEFSPKYKWFTYSLNFWGIFPNFSGIHPFLGENSLIPWGNVCFPSNVEFSPIMDGENSPNFSQCKKFFQVQTYTVTFLILV